MIIFLCYFPREWNKVDNTCGIWYNDACAPKAKIKIENEIPHSLKMKIATVLWQNFENENFYCSLRENLKLKIENDF